jgi:COP9 signalosome complex subunit 4
MEAKVEAAVGGGDYAALASIFGQQGTGSWQTLGQGEQRTLSSCFVRAAVSSPTFLPAAFSSEDAMGAMTAALGHLPPAVENAADNVLRQRLFDYKVGEEEDYSGAARVLGGLRMDGAEGGAYWRSAADRCDVYVKIAECYLEEDETVEADAAVTKAGAVAEAIPDPENHAALILRYKSTYARVLDANRKFLQAASRYHDLSQSPTDLIDADDLLHMLGRAATCAILAPSGPQRQRVLGQVYKDERLSQLDVIPQFETHSSVLTKMYMNQVLRKDDDLAKFESGLPVHARAVMGDGLTIIERAVMEHNMVAVSKIYASIYFKELGNLLGVEAEKAEKVAAKMVMDGSIAASIDEVDGIITFRNTTDSALLQWDDSITSFCAHLNRICDTIRGN